jgi:hypothetical protein
LRFCLFSKNGLITGFFRFKSTHHVSFCCSLQSKETQKVHQHFRPFLRPEMKKSGFRTADLPSESPILPLFARFLPKMQEKTPFVVVDKRGFFVGGKRWIRTTEVTDNRFTVCSLWPLGNLPKPVYCGGAGERSRTINLLITNQLLCRLSYTSGFLFGGPSRTRTADQSVMSRPL